MRVLLTIILIVCAFYVANAGLSTAIGNPIFAADVLLTNQNYGSGATFPTKVWYNLNLKKMRIDYSQPNGSLIMTVYYDYATKDQYQICTSSTGTCSCARATWTAPQPLFSGTAFSSITCFASDYTFLGGGPAYCKTAAQGCTGFVTNPVQLQGALNVFYNDSATTQLCLVRFTPQTGYTYGPEWHILTYKTSGFNSSFDPTNAAQFNETVLNNIGCCPTPSCTAKLDIALVVDESGSILTAKQDGAVIAFCKNLVGGLNIGPDNVRVGVVFFSGDYDCLLNQTQDDKFYKCGTSCEKSEKFCGGAWRHATGKAVSSSKSTIVSAINKINGGRTCISCGVEQGVVVLNSNPRAGIQKTIILFTDGMENILTDRLVSQAAYAKANGIDIIAIGTYGYRISDLRELTGNDDSKIFTTSDFSGLNALIGQILTSVCQPLPSIETCDFCSGLCSCNAVCSCPTCNNFDACKTSNCDIRLPPSGTAGRCVYIDNPCIDTNPCTLNGVCNNVTGCDYTQPQPKPYAQNNFCFDLVCNSSLAQGYVYTDIGASVCAPSTDNCIVRYCNYTVGNTGGLTGSCVSLNRSTIPFGSQVAYRKTDNQTYLAAGCQRSASDPPCVTYTCRADGGCDKDSSTCKCINNTDCNDGNGCTFDFCNTGANRCEYISRDCWSENSGATCRQNIDGIGTVSTTTGMAYYNGATFSEGANSLPSPNATRNCDQLACWNGARSRYQCRSTSNTTSVCERFASPCPSTGCGDTICRSLGTWSNTFGALNFDTDCGAAATYTCTNADRCNNPSCNGGFTGTGCRASGACITNNGANRCPLVSNATLCNQANVCNIYGCNTTTGCTSVTKPFPTANFCEVWTCNAASGNVSNDIGTQPFGGTPARCPPNLADLCQINYCDRVSQSCRTINRRNFFVSQTQTWTDSSGKTNSITGCNNTHVCFTFGCDALTGQCTVNQTGCGCTNNTFCDDGDGCTDDVCDPGTFTCTNTRKDCWSYFSAGNCVQNGANPADSTVGVTAWSQGIVNPVWSDARPPDNTLTCPQMACFGGQRSQYKCISQSSTVGTCTRITSDCAKGGCLDTICTNLGSWSNDAAGIPQANTDCSTTRPVTCTDDTCGIRTCNTNFVYPGANPPASITDVTTNGVRCLRTDNSSQCQNGDLCKLQGQCIVGTGCNFGQTTTPPTNPATTCFTQSCDPTQGWILTDRSKTQCGAPANLCQFKYCNTTSNQCITINAIDITYQTSVSFVDSFGTTVTVNGCGRPSSDDLACRQYGCNATTGQCFQDVSTCNCFNDDSCADGNGCTINTCNKQANRCEKQIIDCVSRLSNGQCSSLTQTTYTPDTTVGDSLYAGTAPNPNVFTQTDANNLPFPETGVNRTCQELGCYNGAPSKYSCFSVREGEFTCQRIFDQCSRNGCQDNICRTLGGWTNDTSGNFQINSDCGTIFRPNCADTNSCTIDFCNITWVPADNPDLRCIHQLVNETQFCDDGNFCTQDRCDPGDTSGQVCTHTLYDQATLRASICPTPNFDTNCTTVDCIVNFCQYRPLICPDSTLCILNLCNASTSNQCTAYYSTVFVVDACGVCDGDGSSCVPNTPAEPRTTSIAVALGVGLGVGLCVAAILIAILTRTGYAAYASLAMEVTGTATNANTYQDNETHYDTGN